MASLAWHRFFCKSCHIHCDNSTKKPLKSKIIIVAMHAISVGSNAEQCFQNAQIYAPDTGQCLFLYNGYTADRPFKSMNVHSAANTQQLIINCM
eukprot:111263_1